jgi:adenine-specific DNA-methyltransferase
MAKKTIKTVTTLTHKESSRKNIPTAELRSVMQKKEQAPVRVSYPRKDTELLHQFATAALHDLSKFSAEFHQHLDRDLDPQLIWRGKDGQDWLDLVVHAPPLYIQEKVHPKALIDDLLREAKAHEYNTGQRTLDLFADFNGIPKGVDKTEFYQHNQNWSNRMVLGDSLQAMASLAEREGLRGKVQCIYFDPPYGIKFNSNFQWSTTSRDVKDGNLDHITREPEQVKAFRDTWREGIHSYLTYLRDRLTVARDLLTESGSIFVQIGDENVHRVRAVMDEVFGDNNFIGLIWFRKKTMPLGATYLERMGDYIVWFAKDSRATKFRRLFKSIDIQGDFHWNWRQTNEIQRQKFSKTELESNPAGDPARLVSMWPPSFSAKDVYKLPFQGNEWPPSPGQCYPSGREKLERVGKAGRLEVEGNYLRYVMRLSDDDTTKLNLTWTDTTGARDQKYVVETNEFVVQRCILMSTDPGDLVLDPTCGSGTTAYVAEQWGRRWITLDTSRVALALARARIMGARYPYYLLADSKEGQRKEAEVTRSVPKTTPTYGNIDLGFVYQRVPHITLKSIANNAEIDVIWEKYEAELAPLRKKLTAALPAGWLTAYRKQQKYTAEVPADIQEWEVPREPPADWSKAAKELVAEFWKLRIARQQEIDASIAAKAEHEYLYDKPYQDNKKVRVAGPFTVESLSPHRVLGVDENDELIDGTGEDKAGYSDERDFAQMILENLKTTGVQQAHKEDKIDFTSLTPWPGDLICAEGRYLAPSPLAGEEGEVEKRAAVLIGPEFGTVSRPDLVAAAREAADAGFDVLIACAFNYDAHSAEFNKLGRIPVLKARMNADLHMAEDLKNTGKGNLFVIFGEPDIDILDAENGQIQVKVNGVDIFHPNSGEVRSHGPEGIACWFIDTDYNEESFFVRHAYFLGAHDPYKALKTTLKAEINEEAWATLNSDISRPFDKPQSGRIAVKVINHLGDEVMKVFSISC